MRAVRARLAVACLALATLLCAACGDTGVEGRERVRIAVVPFLSYGPVFIGVDEGLFAARGIDVELVELSTYDAVAAVAHGDVDVVANFFNTAMFNAMTRGSRIALVADKGYEAPGACVANGLMVRRSLMVDGRLPDLTALKGRKLEVRIGGIEEFFVSRLLARAGLTLSDMEVHRVPWNAKTEALRAGAIDLTAWSEPNLTRAAEAGIGTVLAGAGEIMPGGQWAFILYGESLLEERREVGVHWMMAYLEGVRRYNQGKTDRNVEILARHTGLDQDLVRRACWMQIRPDGNIDLDGVLEFQRWAVERGYQELVVEPDRFWDGAFIEEAGERLAARTGDR